MWFLCFWDVFWCCVVLIRMDRWCAVCMVCGVSFGVNVIHGVIRFWGVHFISRSTDFAAGLAACGGEVSVVGCIWFCCVGFVGGLVVFFAC